MVENRESVTALLCAWVRAWHSNTERQKIFDDYLAYDFMGKENYDSVKGLIQELAGTAETNAFAIDNVLITCPMPTL